MRSAVKAAIFTSIFPSKLSRFNWKIFVSKLSVWLFRRLTVTLRFSPWSPNLAAASLSMYVLILASCSSALTTTLLVPFLITTVTFISTTYSPLVSFMCIAVVCDLSGQSYCRSLQSPASSFLCNEARLLCVHSNQKIGFWERYTLVGLSWASIETTLLRCSPPPLFNGYTLKLVPSNGVVISTDFVCTAALTRQLVWSTFEWSGLTKKTSDFSLGYWKCSISLEAS